MKKLILDTNIWYYLGNDEISLNYSELEIVATYNCLDEILISPNLFKDFDLCQNAIIKMFELHKGLIIKNPIEYLINIDNGQIKDFDEHYESLLNHSKKIASGEFDADCFKEKWFQNALIKREIEKKGVSNKIMKELNGRKKLIKTAFKEKQLTKEIFWKKNDSDFTKSLIKVLIKEHSLTNYKLSDTFDWSQIEFFTKIFEQYLKMLMISTKKIQPNDLYDFFNTVYVGPGDKYFTKDKYWLMLFEKAGVKDYLFVNE